LRRATVTALAPIPFPTPTVFISCARNPFALTPSCPYFPKTPHHGIADYAGRLPGFVENVVTFGAHTARFTTGYFPSAHVRTAIVAFLAFAHGTLTFCARYSRYIPIDRAVRYAVAACYIVPVAFGTLPLV
jgi:hypothetical protein